MTHAPNRGSRPRDRVGWALGAAALAGLGILASAAGSRYRVRVLERIAGPALTLAGAALWGWRLLGRRGRGGV